ncbi:MAG: hypothetical protein HY369_03660 [Candidatus Aenigmarchaeota archaeon]|nr:hypothetical protein [Candidatus Aenigmarchaeota archaeon]
MKRPLTREDYEELVKKYAPGARKVVIRGHGGRASKAGELFADDQAEVETEDGLLSLRHVTTYSCDRGHMVGGELGEIAGACQVCGALLCSREGCARMCGRGHVVCGAHSVSFKGQSWCTRHVASAVAAAAAVGAAKAAGRGIVWFLKGLGGNG